MIIGLLLGIVMAIIEYVDLLLDENDDNLISAILIVVGVGVLLGLLFFQAIRGFKWLISPEAQSNPINKFLFYLVMYELSMACMNYVWPLLAWILEIGPVPDWVDDDREVLNMRIVIGEGGWVGGWANLDHQPAGGNADVHEHTIQNHLRQGWQQLSTWRQGLGEDPLEWAQLLRDIRRFLDSEECELNGTEVEQARNTLNQMEVINAMLISLDAHELQVLETVWARINHEINASRVADLRNNLAHQLADASRPGGLLFDDAGLGRGVVCSTGRVTRIIQSLDHADVEGIVDLNNGWGIRHSIPNLVVKYRDRLLRAAGPKYEKLYNEELDDEHPGLQLLIKKLRRKVKRNIEKHLDGKLDRRDLDELIDPQLEGI